MDIEGLALNGFVREVELVDCESISSRSRRSKLRVKLFDGKLLETECLPYERAVRSYLVILRYLEFGKLISSKQLDEEFIESLKFDVVEETGRGV